MSEGVRGGGPGARRMNGVWKGEEIQNAYKPFKFLISFPSLTHSLTDPSFLKLDSKRFKILRLIDAPRNNLTKRRQWS